MFDSDGGIRHAACVLTLLAAACVVGGWLCEGVGWWIYTKREQCVAHLIRTLTVRENSEVRLWGQQ